MSKNPSRVPAAIGHVGALTPYVSKQQLNAMVSGCRTEEKNFFFDKLQEYADRVTTMPKTYEQDGKGQEAIVYLHYFYGGMDWYITERDKGDGTPDPTQHQAFGLAAIGYEPELGYISIQELIDNNVELDLYFSPKPLKELPAR